MTTPALSLDAAALANFVNAVNDPPGLRIWDDAPEHSLVTRGLAVQHSGEPAIVSRAASVQIFSDRIVVASPGYPPAPLTLAKLRKGNYRPCSRNPLIAQALATDPVTSPFSLRGRPFQLSAFRISAFPPCELPQTPHRS